MKIPPPPPYHCGPLKAPTPAMPFTDRIRTFARRVLRFRDHARALEQLRPTAPPAVHRPEAERVHLVLDQVGLPREHEGKPIAADARVMMMIGRYADHETQMRQAIEVTTGANANLAKNVRGALALLTGAPHASDLRIRRAIELLKTTAPQ